MPDVAVLIPWRDGCRARDLACRWVIDRYRREHPDWEVVLATHEDGPWCKPLAITSAARRTRARVFLIADADVWSNGTAEAVDRVLRGRSWAIPHLLVHRLTEHATTQTLNGHRAPFTLPTVEPPYKGIVGGGLLALRSDLLHAVSPDPRFTGWGSEDEAWGYALTTIAGRPSRGLRPLLHLWHPPQQRLSRRIGSQHNEQLRRRYARARHAPVLITRLLEEVTALTLAQLLNRSCTITRLQPGDDCDGYGNQTSEETTIVTVCDLQQRQRNESPDEIVASDWLLVLPAGTAIGAGDTVTVDGAGTFEVHGEPWQARNPRTRSISHLEATVRRTGGTA